MDTNLLLNFNLENYRHITDQLINSNSGNTIYSGKAGAIIYLIELYDQTGEKEILDKILQIEEIIRSELKSSLYQSYSFYSGNMGISYMYLQLYKLLKDPYYLDVSKNIAKHSKNHLAIIKDPVIDLLNGVSGTMLGLLHLLNDGIEEPWIIRDIEFYIKYILSNAEVYEYGIAWDRSHKVNQCLTGFSHGACGIGFVFNEIYRLTKIEVFRKVAYLSFDYENKHFDTESQNWLDFRKNAIDKNEIDLFKYNAKLKNIDFFSKRKTMTAWCHGSPGILLSRLNHDYEEENFQSSLNKIIESLDNVTNHSICHSSIGNALCLMEIYQKIESNIVKKRITDKILSLSNYLIDFYNNNHKFLDGYPLNYKKTSNSYNLFMGELGVMYFLLMSNKFFKNFKIEQNIMFPKLEIDIFKPLISEKFNHFTEDVILKELLKTKFSKTVYFVGENIDYDSSILSKDTLKEKIHLLNNNLINDVFFYEKSISDSELDIESYSYTYYKNIVDREYLKQNEDAELLKSIVFLNKVKIISSNYNWDYQTNPHWSLNEEVENKDHENFYIIVPQWETHAFKINAMIVSMVNYIKNQNKVSITQIISKVLEDISIEENEKQEAQVLVLQNLKNLIKKGVVGIDYEKI